MANIFLEIKTCVECPFCKSYREFTADPFETVFSYKCGKEIIC